MEPLPWYRIVVPSAAFGALALFCWRRPNPRARTMLLGGAAFGGYGVLQDQVSARLCPEYFTALHNSIPGVTDPTLLGLLWGLLAGVPGGLIAGYALGLAATVGRGPAWGPRRIVRPLLAVVGFAGFVTAVTGWSVVRHLSLFEVRFGPVNGIPPERVPAAFVVACYHAAAYAASVAGTVAACVWVGVSRGRSLDGRAAGV